MSEQSPVFIQTAAQLLALCAQKSASTIKEHDPKEDPGQISSCACTLKRAWGWTSISETEWPKHMTAVATLRNPDIHEPTFEEYHPNATHYDSVDAPVALSFFPTNRCTVFECNKCAHFALRYTEFGGYYVDPRARLLNPKLIVEEPN